MVVGCGWSSSVQRVQAQLAREESLESVHTLRVVVSLPMSIVVKLSFAHLSPLSLPLSSLKMEQLNMPTLIEQVGTGVITGDKVRHREACPHLFEYVPSVVFSLLALCRVLTSSSPARWQQRRFCRHHKNDAYMPLRLTLLLGWCRPLLGTWLVFSTSLVRCLLSSTSLGARVCVSFPSLACCCVAHVPQLPSAGGVDGRGSLPFLPRRLVAVRFCWL